MPVIPKNGRSKPLQNPLVLDLDALPPLSPLAIELLQLRIGDDAAEQRLQRIVSSEPQLAARLVAVANSAAFGLGTVRFATVALALRRIGLRRALHLSLAMLFGQPVSARLPARMREDLWLHALAQAGLAAEIARLLRVAEPAEAYLAGLVHDLGFMLIELAAPGALARVQALAASEGISREAAERRLLGADHGEITASLLGHWGVPDTLVDPQRDHHREDCAAQTMAAALHAAERLAGIEAFADGTHRARTEAHPLASPADGERVVAELAGRLGLDAAELTRVVERVGGQVDGLSGFSRAIART